MQQLQQLKDEYSIQIEKGTKGHWTNTGRIQEIGPDRLNLRKLRGKIFAVAGDNPKEKVIGFIDLNSGKLYITPYTRKTDQILRNAGYQERAFFVPMAPKDMRFLDESLNQRWQEILTAIRPKQSAIAICVA